MRLLRRSRCTLWMSLRTTTSKELELIGLTSLSAGAVGPGCNRLDLSMCLTLRECNPNREADDDGRESQGKGQGSLRRHDRRRGQEGRGPSPAEEGVRQGGKGATETDQSRAGQG